MNIEYLHEFCLSLPSSDEKMPFDEKTLVFTVSNKMFCLTNVNNYEFVNLKCEPDQAEFLRAQYDYVKPGYHMNKKHWNSVYIHQMHDIKLLRRWILESYALVAQSLPKKHQPLQWERRIQLIEW